MNPATRNPALSRLDALVGEWGLSATFGDETFEGGRTVFRWMDDADFLVQRTESGELPPGLPREMIENMPEPVTTVFGLDDSSQQFTMLYSDARGVVRVYQMTLEDRLWQVWRDAPGFNQRFIGRFSEDGNTIDGYWEFSDDGSNWTTDFRLRYTRRSHTGFENAA
jgi:hypothetical protein